MNKYFPAVIVGVALMAAAVAQEKDDTVTLHVGDPAPKLQCGKWIQGEPVTGFETGKVYVVEFWATWCGPCRSTIPHLNAIHNTFKDKGLVVIGQNVWERGKDVEGAVAKFVKKMDSNMTYRVALDSPDGGKMATSWMTAAGQSGIPCAFVVDQSGKIVWMGHPAEGLDTVVGEVLAGKFKPEKEEDAATAKDDDVTLHIGDPAPKLQCGKWIQGEPVAGFETGKVYVVDFWSTGVRHTPPIMPILTALQNRFKDKGLVVIGQDVWERGKDVENAVTKYVKKMGSNMTYRVALDSVEGGNGFSGKMVKSWMIAAGCNRIPISFVVDQSGRVAWIGYPRWDLGKVVEEVLAGKFDLEKAKKEFKKRQKEEAKRRKKETAAWERVAKKVAPYHKKIMVGTAAKDWEKVYAAVDEMEKTLPASDIAKLFGDCTMLRFNIAVKKQDGALAAKFAARLHDDVTQSPWQLNFLAWTLLTKPGLEPRDVALAEKIATKALAATEDENPGMAAAIADTLARAQFMSGAKDKAIATQKKAVQLCKAEEQKADCQKTLDSYVKGVLPPVEPDDE